MDRKQDDERNNSNENESPKGNTGNKLRLNRETVRQLNVLSEEELAGVAGAAIEIMSYQNGGGPVC
jgi:hypothetical protein